MASESLNKAGDGGSAQDRRDAEATERKLAELKLKQQQRAVDEAGMARTLAEQTRMRAEARHDDHK